MNDFTNCFNRMVFDESKMRERLPATAFNAFLRVKSGAEPLTAEGADIIAAAMKSWALENGAAHFTHWFQPMTGITAEKHESFFTRERNICAAGGDSGAEGERIIHELCGGELISSQPDASSFPSGGLRSTFEARGYTAWDPTSNAFIKNNTLYIPTAFCSYGGEALDYKTPLLRSMAALDLQGRRVLAQLGTDAKNVFAAVGAEQEYFLVNKRDFHSRPDLIYCGRTLFGAKPPRTQELGEHYFGAIKPEVLRFMRDAERQLLEIGVPVKTCHKESSPSQYELATLYEAANVASDHNQLVMEILKTVAERHGFVCLLHEKPFAHLNGSGKHNNWSVMYDGGVNLLEPGDAPAENLRFLLFFMAVIKAVDEHADLLRFAAASASNDLRLGACEAPPAVISVFLGEELTALVRVLAEGKMPDGADAAAHRQTALETGVAFIPKFNKDSTDRNRTSPFAFTGNKFEFRMPGSQQPVPGINTVLNTVVAEALCEFADELEGCADKDAGIIRLLQKTAKNHRRIIFNGNNYSAEWAAEAERRHLPKIGATPDALKCLTEQKNVRLFEKHNVYSRAELLSRYEIQLEKYIKTVKIEAQTLLLMLTKGVLPASAAYQSELVTLVVQKKLLRLPLETEKTMLMRLSDLTEKLFAQAAELEIKLARAETETKTALSAGVCEQIFAAARTFETEILPRFEQIRSLVDPLETLIPQRHWQYPICAQIMETV